MLAEKEIKFKLGLTNEDITPRAGIAVYLEFLRKSGITGLIDKFMPAPGSNRGYKPSAYIESLMLMLFGGGRYIEDLREIKNDKALNKLLNLKIPSLSTFGDWLRRYGKKAQSFSSIMDKIAINVLKNDKNKEYTLCIDPTIIESNKLEAHKTYMGYKGYRPVIATLLELPIVIYHEFRDGNKMGGMVEILAKVFAMMPKGKRIKLVLLDSEFYNFEIINFLNEKNVSFAISADKTKPLKDTLKSIKDWKEFKDLDDIATDRQIGESVHCLNQTSAFRIVALKWLKKERELFDHEPYNYHVIATNLECLPEEVIYAYNLRVHIENDIKELKLGFSMEYMPSGDYFANSLYFAVGVFTYNTLVIIKHNLLPESFLSKTISTIRWSVINIGARVVSTGRSLCLKLASSTSILNIYEGIRNGGLVFT